eukprot:gene19407-65558_t
MAARLPSAYCGARLRELRQLPHSPLGELAAASLAAARRRAEWRAALLALERAAQHGHGIPRGDADSGAAAPAAPATGAGYPRTGLGSCEVAEWLGEGNQHALRRSPCSVPVVPAAAGAGAPQQGDDGVWSERVYDFGLLPSSALGSARRVVLTHPVEYVGDYALAAGLQGRVSQVDARAGGKMGDVEVTWDSARHTRRWVLRADARR